MRMVVIGNLLCATHARAAGARRHRREAASGYVVLHTCRLRNCQACRMRAESADRTKTTVVIADDHTVVRQGLRLLIDAEPDCTWSPRPATLPDAMRLTRAHRPTCWCSTSTCRAARASRRSRACARTRRTTAIVVLTMQDDPAFARQALQAGALGFVLKEAADEELLEAIRLAADGETYLNPRLGAQLAAQPRRAAPARPTT